MTKKFLVAFMLYMISIMVCANPENYYANHENGWHWYKDNIEEDKKNEDIKKEETEEEHQNRIEKEMLAVQRKIDTARKEIVLNPTEETLLNFIKLLQESLERSEKVSEIYKRVILKHPELDYNLVNPANSAARKLSQDIENKKTDEKIVTLAKTMGLFFFYHSTCPYCKAFAPTVKEFAEIYKFKLIPITIDGISLPDFPNSAKNQGQAERFQVKSYPSLFAVNPYTEEAIPISNGLLSFQELKVSVLDAINFLQKKEKNER